MNELLKRLSVGALIGLLVGLVIGFGTNIDGFFLTDLLSGYEYQSYDARMRASVAGSEEASIDTVVIIDIEQQSTAPTEEGGLGRYYNWPQAYHGQLIDVVTSGEPAALLFDIIFDPENTFNFDLVNALNSDSAPEDEFLADVTNQFLSSNDPTRMVTSTYESQKTYHALVFEAEDTLNFLYKMDSEPDGYDRLDHIIQLPIEQASRLPRADRLGNTYTDLLQASARTGSANFPQDEDGVIRRCPTVIWFEGPNHVYPSLTLAAAMDMLGIPNDGLDYDFDKLILTLRDTSGITVREIPIDEKGRMYVNYFGYYKTFYYLPYMYCIDPDILDPSYWKGKVVLVGASLPGLMDLRNTPVQETFAGVEIHANVIHSILQNQFVSITSADTNLWLILMICISLGVLVSISSKPLYTLPIPLVAIIAWIIFTYNEFFTGQVMWEIIRPTLSMGSTYLGIFLYNFLVVEKDKRFLKNTFGTYISPELIEQMIDEKTEPQLGGEEAVHTALFTDIQSFSSFSEKLSPIELVELLNDYLTEMTNILLDNNGTLDKYVGDAIIAFYGAPMPVENHEYQACITAIKMQTQLKVLRKKWKAEGDRWPTNVHGLQNRIGIHTGSMVTGNMGSTQRMNYTMMGDSVNLAARLESSAKQYGVYIQISEDTYGAVKDTMTVRRLDHIVVIGRKEPIQTYELISEKGAEPDLYKEIIPQFHEALEFYKKQNWGAAIEKFKKVELLEEKYPGRKTNPSRVFIERCLHLKENPPEEDWDGAWTLLSK